MGIGVLHDFGMFKSRRSATSGTAQRLIRLNRPNCLYSANTRPVQYVRHMGVVHCASCAPCMYRCGSHLVNV